MNQMAESIQSRPEPDKTRFGAQVLVIGGLLAFLRFYSFPANPRFTVCAFHWMTGRPCPLCGMTRGLSALMKGEWTAGIQFNALSPLVLAIFVVGLIIGILQLAGVNLGWHHIPSGLKKNFWALCLLAFLAYGVVRCLS